MRLCMCRALLITIKFLGAIGVGPARSYGYETGLGWAWRKGEKGGWGLQASEVVKVAR